MRSPLVNAFSAGALLILAILALAGGSYGWAASDFLCSALNLWVAFYRSGERAHK